MADLISALIAMQLADARVTSLIGNRVFGNELPADEAQAMPRHALVIVPSGGAPLFSSSYAPIEAQRIDLFAYGPTPFEANRLLARASRVFTTARRRVWAGVLVSWINSAGGYSAARDRDVAWPRAFRSFQVLSALPEEA